MKEIVTERINWVIIESDNPDSWPSPKDHSTQLYLVRPYPTHDDIVIARFDRKACRFRDGNMLFHGSLWAKWKSLDDLLPTRRKRKVAETH